MTRASLALESLETRDVPATFGTPWPDGKHLTLSFAPDGTPISGVGSNLSATLATIGPNEQQQILRAFETWAEQTNVNMGVVSDNGAAFGTGGPVQGDPRFGDIRIGGRPLAADVLAITTPYNADDPYSGDVVINTAANFGPGGDLYTVVLHEAGHALGLGDSTQPTSAMYEDYIGPRQGLSSTDVAAIQSLYGVRQPDQFEGQGGNGTPAAATPYPAGSGPITADITTPQDVDVYKFTAGFLTASVTVNLQAAGLSLLTARVELLDSAGNVLTTAAVTDPTHNDLTLSLNSLYAGETYYVRVSSATGDFAVGSYELSVKQSSILSPVTDLLGGLLQDVGNLLGAVVGLVSNSPATSSQKEYTAQGTYTSSSDVNVYSITVPPSTTGGTVNVLVTIWGADGGMLNPWLEVDDLFGQKLAFDVLTADGNTTTIQIRGLQAGETYLIKTFSDSGSVGNYTLSVDLGAGVVTVPQLASGTVDAGTPPAVSTLSVEQSGQVHLVLTAAGASGSAVAVIRNAAGQVVGQFSAKVDRGRSLDLFLAAGNYTITVQSAAGEPVAYQVNAAVVSDPIGAQPTDPTTDPMPSSPPPSPPPPPSNTSTSTTPSGGTTSPTSPSSPDQTTPSSSTPPDSSPQPTSPPPPPPY